MTKEGIIEKICTIYYTASEAPELNMGNYDDEQVNDLNYAMVEVVTDLSELLEDLGKGV